MDCSAARLSLGVYVLGAIDPAERSLVDAHLATCRDCRDELAGLAGLPALLARVSAEEAFALAAEPFPGAAAGAELPRNSEPPRELLATVLDLTAARQRRRRWWNASLTVAAALIIAVGVFGGLRLGSSPAQQTNPNLSVGPANGSWETVTGHSAGMTATVKYRSVGWGTQLNAEVAGIPVGTNCQLWIIDAAGHRTLAGGWLTDYDEGSVWYPASAAVNSEDVVAFQVTVGKHATIAVKAD
jgi:predicted anti-sigma-YlaC factor YlaD